MAAKTASELYEDKLKNLGLTYSEFLNAAKDMSFTDGAFEFFNLFFLKNSTLAEAAALHGVSYARARQIGCGIFMRFSFYFFREVNKKGA